MKQLILAAVSMCVLIGTNATLAEGAPEKLLTCVGCHDGESGVSANPQWPNLGGQNAEYLSTQLIAYRDGSRENAVMQAIANGLGDDDITELSAWYAAKPLHVAANGDAALVEEGRNRAGYCKSCHGMKGYPAAREWPVLAGQNAGYFAQQLANFKSMDRLHPAMYAVAKDLAPEHMKALAAYYSQFTPDQN